MRQRSASNMDLEMESALQSPQMLGDANNAQKEQIVTNLLSELKS